MYYSNFVKSVLVVCLLSSDVEARKRLFDKTESSVVLESWPIVQQSIYIDQNVPNRDLCLFKNDDNSWCFKSNMPNVNAGW